MDDNRFDELRDLAEGRLPPGRAEALRARMEADPELRALYEDVRESVILTGPAAVTPPLCRVRFEEVETGLQPMAIRSILLRAAAALVLVAGAIALWRSGVLESADPAPGPDLSALVLNAIPLDAAPELEPDPPIPEFLVNYRPVRDGRIQWLDSYETARLVARTTGRSLLLFVQVPSCGYCTEMHGSTLSDPEVVRRTDRFIPVRINAMTSRSPVKFKFPEEWPWFGVLDESGTTRLAFPGVRGPGEFVPRLDEAAGLVGSPLLEWDQLNDLVARLLAARENEDQGWLDDAHDEYVVIRENAPEGPLRVRARNGLRRIAGRARFPRE